MMKLASIQSFTPSVVSLALLLVLPLGGCGGGGSTEIAPASAGAVPPGTEAGSEANLFPTGAVHLVGKVRSSVVGQPLMHDQSAELLKSCNSLRRQHGVPENGGFSRGQLARVAEFEEWRVYDGPTGAARTDRIGPSFYRLPDYERYGREAASIPVASRTPPDCSQVQEIVIRHTTIWQAGGRKVDVSWDEAGTSVKRVTELGTDNIQLPLTVPQGVEAHVLFQNTDQRRCIVLNTPPLEDKCVWDRYVTHSFRNLPLRLTSTLKVGLDIYEMEATAAWETIPAAPPWSPNRFDEVPSPPP